MLYACAFVVHLFSYLLGCSLLHISFVFSRALHLINTISLSHAWLMWHTKKPKTKKKKINVIKTITSSPQTCVFAFFDMNVVAKLEYVCVCVCWIKENVFSLCFALCVHFSALLVNGVVVRVMCCKYFSNVGLWPKENASKISAKQ